MKLSMLSSIAEAKMTRCCTSTAQSNEELKRGGMWHKTMNARIAKVVARAFLVVAQ